MGDMAEVWEGYAERSKVKRAKNREQSERILTQFKVPHSVHNHGAHIIIECAGQMIDFWPGTGKWIIRGGPDGKRGVMNLVTFYQRETKEKS